jgi:UDP-glucose 4-epimerase
MRLFIIGGAGYIGSHMVKLAHTSGYDVITIDNLSTGHKQAVKYGIFEQCDILDTNKLDKLFKLYKPDAVMHFGAYSIVSESMKNPYKYYNNNVSATLKLLNTMIENNCKYIIFSSTAAVFGEPLYLPIDEKHPKQPMNPYGASKLMVEQILKDFDKAYNLKSIIFRYFNASGHDKDGQLSENHNPETHLLPLIMQTVEGKRDNIKIFGTNYDTKDGTCIRDYIHVEDLCEAHLKGLNYLLKYNNSNDFNLGNGKGFSVKEIINTIKIMTNKDFQVIEALKREGDPAVLISSNEKAFKYLNFIPKYDTLEKIISTLIKEKNV